MALLKQHSVRVEDDDASSVMTDPASTASDDDTASVSTITSNADLLPEYSETIGSTASTSDLPEYSSRAPSIAPSYRTQLVDTKPASAKRDDTKASFALDADAGTAFQKDGPPPVIHKGVTFKKQRINLNPAEKQVYIDVRFDRCSFPTTKDPVGTGLVFRDCVFSRCRFSRIEGPHVFQNSKLGRSSVGHLTGATFSNCRLYRSSCGTISNVEFGSSQFDRSSLGKISDVAFASSRFFHSSLGTTEGSVFTDCEYIKCGGMGHNFWKKNTHINVPKENNAIFESGLIAKPHES